MTCDFVVFFVLKGLFTQYPAALAASKEPQNNNCRQAPLYDSWQDGGER